MKKSLSFLLIVITSFTVVLLCTACYSPGSGGLLFSETEGGYMVTGFSGKERFYKNFTVDIPSQYDGKPVVAISDAAFIGYTSLVSVTIPDTVTRIGSGAFTGCVLLPEIDIPDSVTYIGEDAFAGCLILEKIELPESLEYIGDTAFKMCPILEEICIPDSVTHIGINAFDQCDALAYKEYENGCYLGNEQNPYAALIKIKDIAVDSFIIHSGAKAVQSGLLNSCGSLTSLTFEGNVPYYPYAELPDLYTVTVKSGTIRDRAFEGCKELTNIVIGDSVERIGSFAFLACEAMENVTLPISLQSIGKDAFGRDGDNQPQWIQNVYYTGTVEDWCRIQFETEASNPLNHIAYMYIGGELLTELTIPDFMTDIAGNVFSGCRSLKRVVIPSSVTVIGDRAFNQCLSLENVEIPDTVTTVGCAAFFNCALKTVKIPDSVTNIGDSAFYFCDDLTCVEIPDSVTSVGDAAFFGCRSLAGIVIPDSVTYLGYEAFSGCSSLESVRLGNGITEIPILAFHDCSALTSIELGDAVTSIEDRAFESCSALVNFEIPETLVYVGADAFEECSALQITQYKNVRYFGNANNPYHILLQIIDKETRTCEIHQDTKVIASGAFEDWKWMISSIVLPDGVVGIGRHAFSDCENLASINIPKTVMRIGEYAFEDCKTLKEIVIPVSVTRIGRGAFEGCEELTICCEAEAWPNTGDWEYNQTYGWHSSMNPDKRPIVWGYTEE